MHALVQLETTTNSLFPSISGVSMRLCDKGSPNLLARSIATEKLHGEDRKISQRFAVHRDSGYNCSEEKSAKENNKKKCNRREKNYRYTYLFAFFRKRDHYMRNFHIYYLKMCI
ncbi:hypothetical protein NPIL_92361 [Nephila pilipes]|uniref:Uncharacterized protein n=1 Tax=Nephila pilipes TaxID=299642 RepID=A0A8X6TXD7_NEPPI|nr:hypothetical protein NPIL_92361 [Nephila pilipes]